MNDVRAITLTLWVKSSMTDYDIEAIAWLAIWVGGTYAILWALKHLTISKTNKENHS